MFTNDGINSTSDGITYICRQFLMLLCECSALTLPKTLPQKLPLRLYIQPDHLLSAHPSSQLSMGPLSCRTRDNRSFIRANGVCPRNRGQFHIIAATQLRGLPYNPNDFRCNRRYLSWGDTLSSAISLPNPAGKLDPAKRGLPSPRSSVGTVAPCRTLPSLPRRASPNREQIK
jgi:hypothetical protein